LVGPPKTLKKPAFGGFHRRPDGGLGETVHPPERTIVPGVAQSGTPKRRASGAAAMSRLTLPGPEVPFLL